MRRFPPLRAVAAHGAIVLAALVAACTEAPTRAPGPRPLTAAEGRALVSAHLPAKLGDRAGWATDIFAAMASLRVDPTPRNVCAIVAITEQESGFEADPVVPNLGHIAERALEQEREKAGIPSLVLDAALLLPSKDGRSYRARIDAAHTERELSDVFDDFIDRVPLGKRFLADRNPVRTGGPMQVSVAYAQAHAERKPYPYPVGDSLRHEVFSRRGGVYFGSAHLLDYPADYPDMIYRFADFNAGQYASRNAAFQKAVSGLSGVPLAYDGDLVRFEHGRIAEKPGSTELAVRVIAPRLGLDAAQYPPRPRARAGLRVRAHRALPRGVRRSRRGGRAPRAARHAPAHRPLEPEVHAQAHDRRLRSPRRPPLPRVPRQGSDHGQEMKRRFTS